MPLDRVQKELLQIENKFAAIAMISKHSRRLRDVQNVDRAERQGLSDFVHGRVAVDQKSLPEFLRRETEDEGTEVKTGKKRKAKKKGD